MTSERFKEMLRALLAGDTIELRSCANLDQWIPVAIDRNVGQFLIFADNKWFPCAIGGPGDNEWRRYTLGSGGNKTA